jgi:flagellar assembly protein FliH
MQNLRIKIPKKTTQETKKLENSVIKDIIPEIELYKFEELTKDPVDKEFNDFDTFFEEFQQELIPQKTQTKSKKKVERPTFAAYFAIKNLNKIVDIDLSKVTRLDLTPEEMQQNIQAAYDKGFEDGQQVTQLALAEEFHKFENWVRRIDKVIENLDFEFSIQIRKLKDILVPLAIKISEHIIRTEIKANPLLVEKQIEKVLELIDNEKVFELRLNPSDVEILKSVESKLLKDPKLEGVEIVPDPNIGQGGCILETQVGQFDATINSQLSRILNALNNMSISIETEDV